LVRADNRGVDEQLFHVSIIAEYFSDSRPYPAFFPASKANVYRVPVAEIRRQIPPRTSRTGNEEHCLNKTPVIYRSATFVRRFPRQQIRYS
jgi:hypothetical protein